VRIRNLAALLFFLGAFALAALAPRPFLDNSVEAWLPRNNTALEEYQQFRADFGSDEVLLVQLRNPQLKQGLETIQAIEAALLELPVVPRILSINTLYPEECEILSDPKLGGFKRNWKRLQKNFSGPLATSLQLFNPDPESPVASLYVSLKAGGSESRATVEKTLAPFIKENQSKAKRLRVASFALVNLELDRASRAVESQSMPILVVLCVGLVLLTTRSPRLTAALFIPVGLGVFASEGLLGLSGASSNLIVTIVKPMLFVLILAAGLHIVVRFQNLLKAQKTSTPADLAWLAAREKAKPCLLAFATTALGFGSLAVAEVLPIKVFGLLTASSLILAAGLILVLLPGMLSLLGSPRPKGDRVGPLERVVLGLTSWGTKHCRILGLASLLTLPLGYVSFQYLTVEPHAIRYFPTDHPLRADHEALEKQGRGLASLELILESSTKILAKNPNRRSRLVKLDQFLNQCLSIEGVTGRIDASLLLRESGFQSARTDSIPANYFIDKSLDKLQLDQNGSLTKDGKKLRSSLFIKTLDADQISAVKNQIIENYQRHFKDEKDLNLTITGSYALLLKTQKSLLTTLQNSLIITFLLMEGILLLALQSWRLALLSIIPNVLPVAGNFLFMVLSGMALDVGTTMTAAIALGIAVDDTIHFLSSWQKGGIEAASRDTGKAIILSSLIIGVGFASLISSPFSPTRAFGILCTSAMMLALVGDLVILPALLKLFGPDNEKLEGIHG
jgi:uncharacterized protein